MRKKAETYVTNCTSCGNECVLFDVRDGEDVWTHGEFTPLEDRDHKPTPDL